MRLNNYLIKEDQNVDYVINFIWDNCQPYFKELGGVFRTLYRGAYNAGGYSVKKTRRDRKPMDTPPLPIFQNR